MFRRHNIGVYVDEATEQYSQLKHLHDRLHFPTNKDGFIDNSEEQNVYTPSCVLYFRCNITPKMMSVSTLLLDDVRTAILTSADGTDYVRHTGMQLLQTFKMLSWKPLDALTYLSFYHHQGNQFHSSNTLR